MPVVSFNFDKFLVERKKALEAPINVDSGMKILDIKKEEFGIANNKESLLKIDYEFNVKYEPKQAVITIEGHLLFAEAPKKIEDIFNQWKKDKKFDPSITQIIMNNVLMKCNIKALSLGQDVGLPPHIRLPLIQPSSGKKQTK